MNMPGAVSRSRSSGGPVPCEQVLYYAHSRQDIRKDPKRKNRLDHAYALPGAFAARFRGIRYEHSAYGTTHLENGIWGRKSRRGPGGLWCEGNLGEKKATSECSAGGDGTGKRKPGAKAGLPSWFLSRGKQKFIRKTFWRWSRARRSISRSDKAGGGSGAAAACRKWAARTGARQVGRDAASEPVNGSPPKQMIGQTQGFHLFCATALCRARKMEALSVNGFLIFQPVRKIWWR